MKIILFIALSVLFFSCAKKNADSIVVNFKVQNMTISKVGVLYDGGGQEVMLDKNGEGTCTIEGMDNLYASLFYGETEPKTLFLQKGDNVTISFDARKFKDGIHFEGVNAPVVDFLNSVRYTELGREVFALPLNEYNERIGEKIKEAVTLLKARKLDEVNPSFVNLEEGRIQYMYASNLLLYPMAQQMLLQDTAYRIGDDLCALLSDWAVERDDLIDVEVYRQFMDEAVNILAYRGNVPERSYDRTVGKMKYIAENFKNEKVKQPLLNSLAVRYVRANGIKDITGMENIYNTYVTDPLLRDAYKKEYDVWDIASPGRTSPDFEGKDTEGKTYSLKDFKGKYLYIDLWATWCGPCKKEIPYMKELEKKFEGKNITFLGLSTDKDQAAWEEMVKSGKLSGTQLLIVGGTEFMRDYDVDGIPRFILLDPDGKIVNANMLRPSSSDIENTLNALPGI